MGPSGRRHIMVIEYALGHALFFLGIVGDLLERLVVDVLSFLLAADRVTVLLDLLLGQRVHAFPPL